jgi:prevent-host-death family protein
MYITLEARTMLRIIGVTELQRRFRSVFDQVVKRNTPYVLTRGSRPEAALISYEEFLRYQALREGDVLARFDRLVARMAEQNAAVSEEEVATDVTAALSEVDAGA